MFLPLSCDARRIDIARDWGLLLTRLGDKLCPNQHDVATSWKYHTCPTVDFVPLLRGKLDLDSADGILADDLSGGLADEL